MEIQEQNSKATYKTLKKITRWIQQQKWVHRKKLNLNMDQLQWYNVKKSEERNEQCLRNGWIIHGVQHRREKEEKQCKYNNNNYNNNNLRK